MKIPFLTLHETDFISQGSHKKCFHYPKQAKYCIKIPYNEAGEVDLKREIHYIKRVLKQRGPQSGILPHYYGKVETNFGVGHVFELVTDYDGKISQSIESVLATSLPQPEVQKIHDALLILRDRMLQYRVICMSIYPENILYQRTGTHDFRLMLINDMGSRAALPLEYYFSVAAQHKIKRYWNRFVASLQQNLPPSVRNIIIADLAFPTRKRTL